MEQGTHRRLATSVAVTIAAAVLASTAAGAAPTRAPGGAKAPTWNVGDCYAEADVDADEVVLASKVACTKEHAVQVVAGAPLPENVGSFPRGVLVQAGAPRAFLAEFAANTCAPQNVVKNLYPKSGKALAKVLEETGVDDWMIPLAGRMGWVLPDADAYAAGATDLLCIYEPDGSVTGTTKGDARKVSTRDPLETLRLCYSFSDDNTRSDFSPCDEAHDVESLFWLGLPVTPQPADVNTWQDADWAPFDEVCSELATVVIGATRKELLVRADTDTTAAPTNGQRFFNCRVYPKSETLGFAAGEIVTGVGKGKLKLVKT